MLCSTTPETPHPPWRLTLSMAFHGGAGSTKREPTVVGKPAEFMLANIADAFGLKRSQICMVGDRLDTDILFGQRGGLTTMLVLSGARPRVLPLGWHLARRCFLLCHIWGCQRLSCKERTGRRCYGWRAPHFGVTARFLLAFRPALP